MAFAKSAMVFLITMALCGISRGAVHWVGDFGGWNIAAGSSIDYKKWARTRNFHVGDVVVFKYNNQFHDVVRVTHQNFKSCNATFPIAVYSTGSDTIKLTRPGHFFFICGLPGHCLSGQKVQIEVTLVFKYNNQFHDVVRVTHQNFKSCNATFPIAVYSTGSDTIKLTRPGHFFFICGLPGHCLSGQKVQIEVTLGQQYLPSFASSSSDQIPHSASVSDEALAPSPAQSNAPSLKSFNFWLALAVLAVGFGFGVTGSDY